MTLSFTRSSNLSQICPITAATEPERSQRLRRTRFETNKKMKMSNHDVIGRSLSLSLSLCLSLCLSLPLSVSLSLFLTRFNGLEKHFVKIVEKFFFLLGVHHAAQWLACSIKIVKSPVRSPIPDHCLVFSRFYRSWWLKHFSKQLFFFPTKTQISEKTNLNILFVLFFSLFS